MLACGVGRALRQAGKDISLRNMFREGGATASSLWAFKRPYSDFVFAESVDLGVPGGSARRGSSARLACLPPTTSNGKCWNHVPRKDMVAVFDWQPRGDNQYFLPARIKRYIDGGRGA